MRNLESYTLREGRLMYRGLNQYGNPIFQQKRVDLLLGLDLALLSGKQQITHAAIVSGDSDLIPAVEVAQQEGNIHLALPWPTPIYIQQLRQRVVDSSGQTV